MNGQRASMASSLAWSMVSSLGTQVLSFLTFALLARLLGATAFGLVALAALVIDLLLIVSNAGINEAVVQRRDLSGADANTAFWLNLGFGLAFCLATVLCAPLVARLFGQPELVPIVTALSAIFAITPIGAIHTARLTRELKFRAIAMRNIAAAVTGAAIGLPLALAGYGVWALVAQRIAVALAMSACAWISFPWLPRLQFQRRSCFELIHFGGYIGLSGTLNQINIRSTEIISGILVGPIAVAYIRAGSRIIEVLNQTTYTPFQQIAMPTLTRSATSPAILKSTYLRLSRMSSFIMFPAFLGMFAVAPVVVAIVFGPGWEPVASAIRIFACSVFASQINTLIIAAVTAAGAARTVLSWTILQIVFGLTAAVAVHRWGWQIMLIAGIARAYVLLPYGFRLLRKHTGIRFSEVLGSLRPALVSSLLMVATVMVGARAFPEFSPVTSLAIWLPTGAATYLAAYFLQDRAILAEWQSVIAMRRASSATA